MTSVSVVIPAHNEASVIGRCLAALTSGAIELDIVVACNGCSDATAELARAAAPGATVIEIPEASKIAALNAGDAAARHFPRFYVDADVEVSAGALAATADVLRSGIQAAAPRIRFDTAACSAAVRRFYTVWDRMPYLNDDMIGSGVYGLSEAGRGRFGAFPDLTADDQFVMQLFPAGERRTVAGVHFVVHPPRDLRSLVRVRTRAYRGQAELTASGLARTAPTGGAAPAVLALARDGESPLSLTVYLAVNSVAKLLARRRGGAWERDESARGGPPPR